MAQTRHESYAVDIRSTPRLGVAGLGERFRRYGYFQVQFGTSSRSSDGKALQYAIETLPNSDLRTDAASSCETADVLLSNVCDSVEGAVPGSACGIEDLIPLKWLF